jgi:predicted enzyme related to lactoylglutathione lyase
MTKKTPRVGTIAWTDLTVPDATTVREFYAKVVGWHHEPVAMGGYDDFNMLARPDGERVAGVCHAADRMPISHRCGSTTSSSPIWTRA